MMFSLFPSEVRKSAVNIGKDASSIRPSIAESPKPLDTLRTVPPAVQTAPAPAPAAPVTPKLSRSVLAQGIEVEGTIICAGDLLIEGKVQGEARGSGKLTIGEHAEVRGEIHAQSVTVLGKVNGGIFVEDRCELHAQGELVGDVAAARLSIADGATFVGKSELTRK